MKITYELDLERFEAWSGGEDTLNRVINEGKCDELEALLEEAFDELDETQLNDVLRFEDEWIYECLDMKTRSQIQDEMGDIEEEMNSLKEDWEISCDDDNLNDEEKIELWENEFLEEYDELKEKYNELKEEYENL